MIRLINYLQDHQGVVVWTCYGLLASLVIGSFFVDRSHAHTWPEHHIPFFWSIFGFAAAAAIIGIARWLGKSGIQARENYYECPFRRDNCPPADDDDFSPTSD